LWAKLRHKNQAVVADLKNLKVLELASVLAGPSAGQFFAELGAQVIKVENIHGGDVTRSWKISGETTDDRSAYFCSINWGKQSIAIDLHQPKGQQIIHELVKNTDIVIASYKPGDAEKLKVDYQTLSSLNPKIIYGQITGYGPHNPKVGYDAIIQAESGFMFMNGEPGGKSLKMPVALIDVLAGHQLKQAILLALIERYQTGKGSFVDVSLIQSAISSLVNQATNWLVAGKIPGKHGSAHPNIAPYGDVFITNDQKELLLAVGNDKQFKALCEILDLNIFSDSKFSTNMDRVNNREKLNEILSAAIETRQSKDLVSQLNDKKIPGGLIQNVADVFSEPHAHELLLSEGHLKGVRNFIGSSKLSIDSHFLPPPSLGEHTEEVLMKNLNYSAEIISGLRQKGVIA
jgi:crotonobetainyl-CoA:carnitine CoA-transferase CaiB-like acyl-CoA transferase